MNNTALGAENKKEQIINFISEAHEKFYYEKLKEVRYQDVYHKALCYCLGISDDIISVSEGLPMLTCIFETASAVGTVGLSLGITPELNLLSRSVLILLMFFGRVGGLTLIFAALSSAQKKVSKLPKEKITVG